MFARINWQLLPHACRSSTEEMMLCAAVKAALQGLLGFTAIRTAADRQSHGASRITHRRGNRGPT